MSCRIQARAPLPARVPRVEHDPDVLASLLTDAAHVPGGFAAGVVFPASEAETAAATAAASHVLPIGAQSSLTGGATPRGEVILSTRGFTGIEILDRHHVRVGAGVRLAQLQQRLAGSGLYYPPAPTYDGASVGGTISTNAAGAATFKYGSTRAWVDAITVVLAGGAVLDVTRGEVAASAHGVFEVVSPDGGTVDVPVPTYRMPSVPKCSAGYYAAPGMDLIDLFIGSEGTLGVITEAVLRVVERPTRAAALIACRDDGQAVALTAMLREQARLAWAGRAALAASAIEYMDARSLQAVPRSSYARIGIEPPPSGATLLLVQMEVVRPGEETFAALADILDACGVEADPLIAAAGDERTSQRLFELREAVPAGVNALVALAKERADPAIEKTAGDFIVPFDRLAASIDLYRREFEARRIDYAIWGHVSDGNLHVNVVPSTLADVIGGREALVTMARGVIRMGGSPLAEHGVGRSAMKQLLLRELYGEDGIEQMRRVKRALDPGFKLSPGVLFPPPGQE